MLLRAVQTDREANECILSESQENERAESFSRVASSLERFRLPFSWRHFSQSETRLRPGSEKEANRRSSCRQVDWFETARQAFSNCRVSWRESSGVLCLLAYTQQVKRLIAAWMELSGCCRTAINVRNTFLMFFRFAASRKETCVLFFLFFAEI